MKYEQLELELNDIRLNPIIRTSFSYWTETDTEFGEPSETGWMDEQGVSMLPDEFDVSDGLTMVDLAVNFLTGKYIESASCSEFIAGVWYISHETDIRTGDITEYCFHLSGFTQEQEKQIYETLREKRVIS